jgi:hypothetical protein
VNWKPAGNPAWLAVAAAFSLLDYAVFLNECGLDSPDERRALPHTLPGIVGQRGVALVALFLWACACATYCALRQREIGRGAFQLALIALGPVVALAGAVCCWFALAPPVDANGSERRVRESLVDAYFTVVRAGLAGFVTLVRLVGHG